jgi:hypothetical protein
VPQAFVFTQSLSAALYMLLFKFMAHQYDYAFRFVSSCVSDTDLMPEEAQVSEGTQPLQLASPSSSMIDTHTYTYTPHVRCSGHGVERSSFSTARS